MQFWQRINALAGPNSTVLDFGAGRGASQHEDPSPFRRNLLSLKGRVRALIGADVDPAVQDNDTLDRALLIGDDNRLPLPDASVDVVVSDFVFEHIQDPAAAARELDRVLKPGGWLCVRTPNRFGYIAIANRMVPAGLRQAVVRSAREDRKDKDMFPAVYRLNTAEAFRRHFPPDRFEHYVIPWDAEPAYHFGSKLLYRLTLAVHHWTPAPLKTVLMVFVRKR